MSAPGISAPGITAPGVTAPAFDPLAVLAIMRAVAQAEIMPRFRNLAPADVACKRSPRDLVTAADIAAERELHGRLQALLPGSAVVGEEATDADPGVLERLAADAPVWLLDPVDGTVNFAEGSECFAVLVALVVAGETVAGFILDPVRDEATWAVQGGGAWFATAGGTPQRLGLAAVPPLDRLRGSLTVRALDRMHAVAASRAVVAPTQIVRYGSTGREYADLARGRLDFAQYRRLKPWDHAAGVLVHREAGGCAGLRGGDRPRPYRPSPQITDETILLAPDAATWQALDALLG